jgi:hypothetical protein
MSEDLTRHIRATVLRLPGGSLYWGVLGPAVEAMTAEQRTALYRVLQNAEAEGRAAGSRHVAKSLACTPWRRRP